MPSRLVLLSSVVLAAVAFTEPATAATVEGTPQDDIDSQRVYISSSGDAADRLTIDATRAGVIVRSGAGRLTAAGLCRSRPGGAVECPGEDEFQEILVEVGAGDDRVRFDERGGAAFALVDGGRGEDRLEAVGGAALLEGGLGRDVLLGGTGGDTLAGGPGRDRLHGRGGPDDLSGEGEIYVELTRGPENTPARRRPSDDLLDGGPGRDRAAWSERRVPVRVDLAARRGGVRGERDRLRSVEGAIGGSAGDVLLGDDGPNALLGFKGGDRLTGRGGRDRLDAGTTSSDHGSGNDGARDRLSCGAGDDLVIDAGVEFGRIRRADPLAPDCERLRDTNASTAARGLRVIPRPLGARRVRVGVSCALTRPCRRTVTLRHGDRLLARRRVRTRREIDSVVLRLRRPLPRRGVLTVRATGNHYRGGGYDFAYRLRR